MRVGILGSGFYRYYPGALEQPWVTVSDKVPLPISRQWPAIALANTVCVEAS